MATKASLDKIAKAIEKKFPKRGGRASGGSLSTVTEWIPTGLEVIDRHVLGTGGLPVGRFGEVFGDKGAGKTSFGFLCLAAAQAAGGVAVLVETEKTLELQRAETFGCDIGELLLIEPDTVQEVIEGLDTVFKAVPKSCGPNVLVWDSLAASDIGGKTQPGKKASIMAAALPRLSRLARDRRFSVVVINQIRQKIGVVFGPSDTTPGGNAMKYHCSYRLQLWAGAAFPDGKAIKEGMHTTIKAVHSKVSIPFRKAKLRLNFETGFDNEWSLMNLGKDLDIIPIGARKSAANLELVRQGLA